MAEATAVLDSVAQPETQTQPLGETQDSAASAASVTDPSGTAQTETTASEGTSEAPPDEGAVLAQREREAWQAAETERLREVIANERLSVQTAESHTQARQRIAQRAQELDGLNGQTLTNQRAVLMRLGATEEQIQAVLQPLIQQNLRAAQIHREINDSHGVLIRGPIQDAVENIVGKDVYPDFVKAADGKSEQEFLSQVVEFGALKSKAVKGLTLEEAEKLSPKLKAELAKRDLQKYKDGREKGQQDPPGEPMPGGTGVSSSNVTYSQLQKMSDSQIKALPSAVFERAISEGK